MSPAEVTVGAYGWAFGRWVFVLAGACVEVDEGIEAGKVVFIGWFVIET